jgi:UDP-N-acetylglucosamine acyltransferase
MNINSTAIIDKEAVLGDDVEIGAYCVIKGKVKIGSGTIIKDHVTIYGPLTMGSNNIVHPGAVLGSVPQDLKYKGEASEVIIGNDNTLRECVTIHQGTESNEGKTVLGNNNLIMAYTHVAHDCMLGNNIIIANATQLAGHIIVQDYAYFGGIVGVHQFVTIGRHSFLGFLSRINKDVPPFVTVEGNPSKERFINAEGLKRRGFSQEDITLLKKAFGALFNIEKTYNEKVEVLKSTGLINNLYVKELLDFVTARNNGKNGRALEAARH